MLVYIFHKNGELYRVRVVVCVCGLGGCEVWFGCGGHLHQKTAT